MTAPMDILQAQAPADLLETGKEKWLNTYKL